MIFEKVLQSRISLLVKNTTERGRPESWWFPKGNATTQGRIWGSVLCSFASTYPYIPWSRRGPGISRVMNYSRRKSARGSSGFKRRTLRKTSTLCAFGKHLGRSFTKLQHIVEISAPFTGNPYWLQINFSVATAWVMGWVKIIWSWWYFCPKCIPPWYWRENELPFWVIPAPCIGSN